MKTTFKSPSAFDTTSFNSSSTITADASNMSVEYLKMVIDKETGRYIKVDTESKPDFIILGLYSATNSFLSSCEFNVNGGVRVTDCSLDLSNKRLIITNSDNAHIYCDLTALLNVIDGKVTSNAPIQGATKTKITYDEKGLVTGGTNLGELDIPVLPIGKITGLNDALFDKVQKNDSIIGSTATKITYDQKGLVTSGTNLVKSDIPNIDAIQVIEDTSHRFITDIEKTTWNNKSDFSGNYVDLTNKPIIPVKVSDLENDQNFVKQEDLPTDLGAFTNNAGYAKTSQIPTDTNQLTNSAGFITLNDVPSIPSDLGDLTNNAGYAKISDIPTNISEFNNDTGYITSAALPVIAESAQNGYISVNNVALKVYDGSNKADLVDGKVPSTQLPSYVIDCYIVGITPLASNWLSLTVGGTPLAPESGKIYVILTAGDYENKTYRWSGSTYVIISETLALGETSNTAYRGDRGKIAYDHSQSAHAPVDAQKNVQSDWGQSDNSKDDYIKNKPSIPTQTSDLENNSGFITADDIPTLKTINNEDIKGVGNISVQVPLIDSGLGQNIKTVNSQSILGIGNLEIEIPDVHKEYVDTELAKKQNIISSDNKLPYSLLSDVPTIPSDTADLTNSAGFITGADLPTFKTINNESIIGIGNIEINPETDYTNLINKPTINNVELAGNVSFAALGIINFSGNYNDLSNKPTIPDIDKEYVDTELAKKQNIIDVNNKLSYSLISDTPNIPANTSDLLNDSGFIDKNVADLINYTTTTNLQNNYVAKEIGKALSTNDYDNTEKANVATAYAHSQSAHNYEPANANIQAHIINTNNPHGVTKQQVGLGNVDDVKQASKAEFDLYANATDIAIASKVPKTREIIGLDLQNNITLTEFKTALGNATIVEAGLMSPEDKLKLDTTVAVTDHSGLTGRDATDSHPMAAITDLSTGTDPYLDQKVKTSDVPEFAGINVTQDWKISTDVEKLKIQQNQLGEFDDIIEIYKTSSQTSPNQKVTINAKTLITDLDFGGW